MATSGSVSELRIVLLAGCCFHRSSVGDFILGKKVFRNALKSCMRNSATLEETKITVVNTPDLQFPTEDKQTEFLKECVRLSVPGPHVFLLVLQPGSFTEEDQNRLYKVLESFSDQSFDHSLILLMKPKQQSPNLTAKYMENVPMKDLIRKCKRRYLMMEESKHPELLTRCGQVVEENDIKHVRYRKDLLPADYQSQEQTTSSAASAKGHG